MQKVVTLTIAADGIKPLIFNEPKEVSALLEQGYKVVSVTPSNSAQGFYCVFIIVLEKVSKKPGSVALPV